MTSTLVRGKYVICKITGPSSAEVIYDGAVLQQEGEIVEVGSYEELRSRNPNVDVVGSSHYVVMPGLVNDHFHVGRKRQRPRCGPHRRCRRDHRQRPERYHRCQRRVHHQAL